MGNGMDRCEYAGFWIRAVACVIDNLLLMVVTIPILISIYGVGHLASGSDEPLFRGLVNFVVSIVLPTTAVILFWKYRQATPGKIAISARVVDARTGESPSILYYPQKAGVNTYNASTNYFRRPSCFMIAIAVYM